MNSIIIGFGHMGQRYYSILNSMEFNVDAVFDMDDSPKTVNDKIIFPQTPNNLIAYIQHHRPNLIVIATTAISHFDYLKLCFDMTIPYVICEKPLCISIKQALEIEMLEKKNKHNTCVAVNHQMRFMDQYTLVKDILNKNKMGKLCSISIQAGNIGIAMNAIHYCEVLRYMTGEYPEKVSAWLQPQSSTNPRGEHFQDYAGCMRMETKSNIRMYMDISENQGHGIFSIYTFQFGQVHVDELAGKMHLNYRKNSENHRESTYYALPFITQTITITPISVYEPTKAVIQSLLNKTNFPSLTDAMMPIKTIIAALYSSENGHIETKINELTQEYTEKMFRWA